MTIDGTENCRLMLLYCMEEEGFWDQVSTAFHADLVAGGRLGPPPENGGLSCTESFNHSRVSGNEVIFGASPLGLIVMRTRIG